MEECRAETVALYCQCIDQNLSSLGNDHLLQWRTIPLFSRSLAWVFSLVYSEKALVTFVGSSIRTSKK